MKPAPGLQAGLGRYGIINPQGSMVQSQLVCSRPFGALQGPLAGPGPCRDSP